MTESSVELECSEYEVRSASIGHSRGGATFRCTISPLPDDIMDSLDAAARANETIQLNFKEPLVLERIEVKRLEPGCVRIVGRIVSP
jgi:hypothetical protein